MRLERRKDIALAFVYHEDTNPRWDLLQPEARAKQLQDELEFAGGGWWQVRVTPYKIAVPEDFTIHYSRMDWEYLWNRVRELNPHHNHNYLHVQGGGVSATVAGIADLSGPHAWTGSGSHHTRVHEQGHTFGFLHDGRGSSVYGGPSRMGHRGFGFHAMDLAETGAFEPAVGDGYYYLAYPDTRTDDVKAITTPDGFRITLVRGHRPELYIYRPKRGQNWVEESLLEGEVSERFPVKFVRQYRGYAEVAVGTPLVENPPEWPLNPQTTIDESKAGIWHNWMHTHQGFLFDVHWNPTLQEWRAVFYWFTHDEHSPRWFWGTGPIRHNTSRMKVHTTHNRQEKRVGEAVIYFTSDSRGVIQYWLDDDSFLLKGRGRIELEKLADKGDDPRSGLFDFKETEREGIYVMADHVYWFGYDGFGQSWFLGDQGKLYVPVGGYPFVDTNSEIQRFGAYEMTETEFATDGGDVYALERLV